MAINTDNSIYGIPPSSGISQLNQSLASGQRINSSADDAAGQAVVSALTTQLNNQDIATRNANDGIALLQTADGASESIVQSLQRMSELALQAQNGTLNASQRDMLNSEFQQNLEAINQTAESTRFNDISLLDGSNPSVDIALGEERSQLILPDLTSNSLGVAGLDISDPANAAAALGGISNAIDLLGNQRSTFGAQQNGLSSAVDNIQSQSGNTYAARSQINDTDYARTLTEQVRQNVLQDSAIAMQAQGNQSRASVLQLLNS